MTTTAARRFSVVATLTIALSLVALWWAPSAYAHDVLVDNMPADGAVLDEAPDEIVLTYNNAILDIGEGATVVNLLDAAGNEVETRTPTVQNRNVITRVDDLPDGAYRVVWRVVSSDGHPIQGTFTFAVGPDGQAELDALEAATDAAVDESEAPAEQVDDPAEGGASLPVIIGISVVVVGLAAAAITVLMRRRTRS